MKILATKDNLLYGINTVQKAISTKNTIPILSGIYLKAVDNKLILAATDLEIGIECKVPVQVIEPGEVVIPARYFSELVRRLPNTKLVIEYIPESISVRIQYDDAETFIKGWLGSEFPSIPDLKDEHAFTIHPSVLKTMIKQTSFCGNLDDSRAIFTGALIEIEQNDLTMVTTDSHRLALRKGKINNLSGQGLSCIVPIKSLTEVSRIAKDDEEEVIHIRSNRNQICFENSEIRMISRLIEGIFPNYRQVIPPDFSTLIKIKKKPFQDAIDRSSLFINERDKTSIIKLNITDKLLNITSKSEVGMVDENIPIYIEGAELGITFNAKYLMDALKNIDFEDLSITLGGPLSPAIIRPLNNDSFLYLLLPLRSNS